MRLPFFQRHSDEVLKLVEARESAISQRDALRQQLDMEKNAHRADLEAWNDERDTLKARVSQLEAELSTRPQRGTEEYDLQSAERLRDRMRLVQPHLPITTSGVFSYSQHQQELFALETLGFKRKAFS
jgi:hypothetical protein